MRQVEERLRRAGYRVTKQRTAVYDYLRSVTSHPTVEEIHRAVRAEFPNISLATVYNAVDSLVDVGLVRKLAGGSSSARYDAGMEEHAHFRCVVCDEIWDVSMPERLALADTSGLGEIIGVNVELFGVCSRCRREKLGLPPSNGETASSDGQ